MNKILYSDLENSYNLLDYNRSHSELILRKRKDNINTDILFKSVKTIFLPTSLVGLEISIVEDESERSIVKNKFNFTIEYGYRIYALKTAELNIFYLNAGVFGVFTNHLDILESSIGDFTWSESNRLILWSN